MVVRKLIPLYPVLSLHYCKQETRPASSPYPNLTLSSTTDKIVEWLISLYLSSSSLHYHRQQIRPSPPAVSAHRGGQSVCREGGALFHRDVSVRLHQRRDCLPQHPHRLVGHRCSLSLCATCLCIPFSEVSLLYVWWCFFILRLC